VASKDKILETNIDGDFFVDSSCIDCGTCRWMAPATFDRKRRLSRVFEQPQSTNDIDLALEALVACPTASIGTKAKHDVKRIVGTFPKLIAENVYHCGFHHEDSFGAASYFIVRPEGNILIDSPRFTKPLVRQLEEHGGVDLLFLTHRDDVADHKKFVAHFACQRVLHADDISQGTSDVEQQLHGLDPIILDKDLTVIPVPGHTPGSACLLYRNKFLFSGDHLAWDIAKEELCAFRTACWYNWDIQIESMIRLAHFDFEHVLPGHRAPCVLGLNDMRQHMKMCIERMKE
jgi:ferredoxin